MRKKCVILLTIALALNVSGCGQSRQNSSLKVGERTETTQENQEELISAPESDMEEMPGSNQQSAGIAVPSATGEQMGENDMPVVYMTTNISSEGLMNIYQALSPSPSGKIAVKLSTGEPGSNYLRPELIGDLVKSLDGTIVECNTAYGGSRANTAMHYQVAEDHGYTAIANVDIMDEDGSMTLTVTGGDNLTENYVGAHFADYGY